MMKPTIELRKISHNKSLSEETPAYTADVYVDGKLFCHVSNHGHGGSDDHHAPKGMTGTEFYPRMQALEALIKATYEPHNFVAGGETMSIDADLELICHQLLDAHQAEKDLKRALKGKVLFTKADGNLYEIKVPKGADRSVVIAGVKARNDITRTLNEMPFAEALAIFNRGASQ